MSTARAVLGNTVIQIAGKVATAAISIIIIKLITNYLGRAGYGEYTAIYEFLAFFGIVADFGIFQIAVSEMSRFPEKRVMIFGNVLTLRLLLTTFSMSVAIVAAYCIPKYASTNIPLGIAIATLTTYFTLVHGTLSAALQSELKIQWSVVAQVTGKAVTLIYMLWAVFYAFPQDLTRGFYHLLIAGNIGMCLTVIQTYLAARRLMVIRLRLDWTYWREVLIKAIPYGTAVIFATIYFRIGAFFLTLFRTTDEVGIYGVAMRIVENTQMLPAFFMAAMLPVLTRALMTDRSKFSRMLQYAFDFLMCAAVPIVVGGGVLAYPIVAIVASPAFVSRLAEGFYGSDVALMLLLIAMGCAFFGNLFNYTLLAASGQKYILRFTFGAALLNVLTNFFVIPAYGFRGAAAVSIVTEAFVALAGWWYVRRLTGASLSFRTTFKAIFAAILMGLTITLLQPMTYGWIQNWGVLILIPLGGIVYLMTLWLTRAVTPEMLALLKKPQPAPNDGNI